MREPLAMLGVLVVVLLLASTQLILKWQANRFGSSAEGPRAGWAFLWAMATSPWVVGALAVTALALPIWLLVLGRLPLSYAYPLVSLSFVLVTLGGAALLHEPLNASRIVGVALIVAGVILVGRDPG
jgi:drug/metabolite transporter (DMT)-like permease